MEAIWLCLCSTLIEPHFSCQATSTSVYVVHCSCNPNICTDSVNIIKCHIPICFPTHTAQANIEKTLGRISVWLITFCREAAVCWIRVWWFGLAALVLYAVFSALQKAGFLRGTIIIHIILALVHHGNNTRCSCQSKYYMYFFLSGSVRSDEWLTR